MSDVDRDLQRQLKQLANEVKPDAMRELVVLDRSRAKRRLAALTSGLGVLLLLGGIAAASIMLENGNGITPGPGPNETSGPPDGADTTSARDFFAAGSRDASAAGVLEINSEQGTLCYQATTENIKASHLLRNTGVVAGGRRFERMIVVTFFDRGDRERGKELSSGSPLCLQEEQLGELEGELQVLIDHPEDFRVDFHRGPNDDPGLIAELQVQRGSGKGRADYYIEESRGFGVHVPEGWRVARRPLTPDLGDPREILSLGTGPMLPGGRCTHQPGRALAALGARDAFISIQERRRDARHPPRPASFEARLEDVVFNIAVCANLDDVTPYWLLFRDAERDFYVLAALGTEASAERRREFWRVLDSLDFEAPYGDD